MANDPQQVFIVSTDPGSRSSTESRLIRSHAAKVSSARTTTTRTAKQRSRQVDSDLDYSDPVEDPTHAGSQAQDAASHRRSIFCDPKSTVPYACLKTIPSTSTRVFHLPFIPAVVSNYLKYLAVPIPEIDGVHSAGQMAKVWFPMTLHSPAAFEATMLFSASHLASSLSGGLTRDSLLQLKQFVLTSLSKAITSNRTDDETIAAMAKLACYEAVFGSENEYHTHMNAVGRMISLRGGIERLGMGGLLARVILFVDTNSAYLLHTHLHIDNSMLPRREPWRFLNTARFVGE